MKTKYKRSFILISTLMLVLLFSIFTISITETNMFSSNLNRLKYLHLQANVHMYNIANYILTHKKQDVEQLIIDDNRYDLKIKIDTIKNKTTYDIFISTKDDTPVTLYKKIELEY